eukprot:TRINITY_DN27778_c0_g1_i1.p6 TRINITY_DN27778_c0_g1~~TRINITY_DN27778_c0_g1_i1.p6  ORF type:complete len:122 (+),score=38.84 TRINITY_DN27778_c0_g1_i1:248-613(+)
MTFVDEYGGTVGERIDLSPHNAKTIRELLKSKGITESTPKPTFKPKPLLRTKHCVAWRATSGCSANGVRAPSGDAQCTADVFATQAGYCECVDGREIRASCDTGRAPFACDDMCKNKQDEL